MEMQAALEALIYLKDRNEHIELFTDSNIVKKGMTEWMDNWKRITGETQIKRLLKIKKFGCN